MGRLHDKVVQITGAAVSIGTALSARFAEEEAKVIPTMTSVLDITAVRAGRRAASTNAQLIALALVLTCTGCGSSRETHHRDAGPTVLYSPNGEPLSGGPLGQPSCEAALSGWFNRIDANHDGAVDRQEYLADARSQFQKMDIGHDGYITASKLTVYRAPYEEGSPAAAGERDIPLAPPPEAEQGHRRGHGPSEPPPPQAARPLTPRTADGVEDPVMSADRSLSFKVSLEDFLAHAGEVFAQMDVTHSDRLTLAAVQSRCPKEPREP